MSAAPKREVSQKELANSVLGLSARQIRNLEDEGLPHRADGRRKLYPIPEAVQWYLQHKKRKALERVEQADYDEAKARREQARARQEEIKLAKEEGRIITREAAEKTYGAALDQVRRELLNMPGRWGAQAGFEEPRKGEKFLKGIAREILDHLSGAVADRVAVGGEQDLPEEFPGYGALTEAGVETFSDLLDVDDLEEVHGIGPVTAGKIRDELGGEAVA